MPASRALTVTTTKDRQNMMWAIRIVQKPSTPAKPALTNSASRDEPITISGVAIGRKIRMFAADAAAEPVPDHGEGHQRAEHGRHQGGEQADPHAEADGGAHARGGRRG